jgi:hypothetical protein
LQLVIKSPPKEVEAIWSPYGLRRGHPRPKRAFWRLGLRDRFYRITTSCIISVLRGYRERADWLTELVE